MEKVDIGDVLPAACAGVVISANPPVSRLPDGTQFIAKRGKLH
jgi:hypothetical protein